MMRYALALLFLMMTIAAHAEEDDSAPAAARPAAPLPQAGPAPGLTRAQPAAEAAEATPGGAPPVKYRTEERWSTAGYNNDEIVYTLLVKNEDTRILRCSAQMSGWYFENGKKLPVSDRQLATVFPEQQAQVGNWMGMDQASGTTYSLKCRPL